MSQMVNWMFYFDMGALCVLVPLCLAFIAGALRGRYLDKKAKRRFYDD